MGHAGHIPLTVPNPGAPLSKRHEPFAQGATRHAWSVRLGRVAGIDVYAHGTFLLLLAWIAGASLLRGLGPRSAAGAVGLILAVFGIVVLHELGHALAARRFGIRTRDILLLPIGGVASLERIPEKPTQELLVAIAGPAVNVFLAILFFALARLTGSPLEAASLDLQSGSILGSLVWVNVSLALFNILPAFPMDGGRVLRALLGFQLGFERSTEIAARVGQAMAVAFGVIGVFANPMLVFVALFVWMGAKQEAEMAALKALLQGVRAEQAMTTAFLRVDAREPLLRAIDRTLHGTVTLLVHSGDSILGVLSRDELVAALSAFGPHAPVGSAIRSTTVPAEGTQPLEDVMQRLSEQTANAAIVEEHGEIAGIITHASIAYLIATRAAMRHWAAPTRP